MNKVRVVNGKIEITKPEKWVMFSIRVHPEIISGLKKLARKAGSSVTGITVGIIRGYLNSAEKE